MARLPYSIPSPTLVPAAIEEMLRYDSPVQLTSGIATADVGADGSVIPADRRVIVYIGGANRDPRVSEQPTSSGSTGPIPGRHQSISSAFITAPAPR
jgi:cytochrome P450